MIKTCRFKDAKSYRKLEIQEESTKKGFPGLWIHLYESGIHLESKLHF